MLDKVYNFYNFQFKQVSLTKISLFLLFVVAGIYLATNKNAATIGDNSELEPLYDTPYIVVYGRNSCRITQKIMTGLTVANIPFEYQIIDESAVADTLHRRMRKAGLSVRRYQLPVVDVNNNLFTRPTLKSVIDGYSEQ